MHALSATFKLESSIFCCKPSSTYYAPLYAGHAQTIPIVYPDFGPDCLLTAEVHFVHKTFSPLLLQWYSFCDRKVS